MPRDKESLLVTCPSQEPVDGIVAHETSNHIFSLVSRCLNWNKMLDWKQIGPNSLTINGIDLCLDHWLLLICTRA